MAGAPDYKVYDADGNYQAAVKEPEAGAALMALYGDGATIRYGHAKKNTLWDEGDDGRAADSWDTVAITVLERQRTLMINGMLSAGYTQEQIDAWLEQQR